MTHRAQDPTHESRFPHPIFVNINMGLDQEPYALLAPVYLIVINRNSHGLTVYHAPEGQTPTSKQLKTIIRIMKDRQVWRPGLDCFIGKHLNSSTYERFCSGGNYINWSHPKQPGRKTLFIVKIIPNNTRASTNATAQGILSGGTLRPKVRPEGALVSSYSQQQVVRHRVANQLQGAGQAQLKNYSRRKQVLVPASSMVAVANKLLQSQPNTSTKKKVVEVIDLEDDDDEEEEDKEEDEDSAPAYLNAFPDISITKVSASAAESVVTSSRTAKETTEQILKSENHTVVIKGNVKGVKLKLPSKSVVGASKALPCLYRVPDLVKFKEVTKDSDISFSNHPFLGDEFLVATAASPLVKVDAVAKVENHQPSQIGRNRKEMSFQAPAKKVPTSDSEEGKSTRPVRSTRGRLIIPANKELTGVSTRKRTVLREMTPDDDSSKSSSSSSGSSSSDSDSSSSDDEENVKPDNRAAKNRKLDFSSKVKQDLRRSTNLRAPVLRRPENTRSVTCFSELAATKPIRKNDSGQIYFNIKEILTPDMYYKNADLFTNWEKFVRHESSVSDYYKTMLTQYDLTTLVIYHMKRCDGLLGIDRSVELASDGSITITLENEDVTQNFMGYVNLETNTDLNAILINLMNSKLCSGAKGFETVDVYPGAMYKEDVWYSGKCSKVVFRTNSTLCLIDSCTSCLELRKHLLNEKIEMEKIKFRQVKVETNKRRSRSFHKTMMKYHPSEPAKKLEIRDTLGSLLFGFLKELGISTAESMKTEEPEHLPSVKEEKLPDPPVSSGESNPQLNSGIKVEPNNMVLEPISHFSNPSHLSSSNGTDLTVTYANDPNQTHIMSTGLPPPYLDHHGMPTNIPPTHQTTFPFVLAAGTGGSFSTYTELQAPGDLQHQIIHNTLPDEFSDDLIASFINSSDANNMFGLNDANLIGESGIPELHPSMDGHSLPFDNHHMGGLVCLPDPDSHSNTNLMESDSCLVTQNLMFPTFSLTDDMT